MQIIIRKAIIVHSPAPPFVGTRLGLVVTEDRMGYGINLAYLAGGCASATVEWGDGTSDTVTGTVHKLAHTYASPGAYEVRLSDAFERFSLAGGTTGPFFDEYPKNLVSVTSNARNLTALLGNAFAYAPNLKTVNLTECAVEKVLSKVFGDCTGLETTDGLPAGLTEIRDNFYENCTGLREVVNLPRGATWLAPCMFYGCMGLSGRIDLPYIVNTGEATTKQPFANCTGGITEIHFAAANEEAVRKSPCFIADPTLGTGTATCVFDL